MHSIRRITLLVVGACIAPIMPLMAQSCSVAYSISNSWPGGFQAAITITNTGTSSINGWTLKWTFSGNQQISSLWNGVSTQSGEAITVLNASYNPTISAGGNPGVIGFTANSTGANAVPTVFTLNGVTCGSSGGTPPPTPPAAPTSLVATAISTSSVTVTWAASATAGVTYNVYRSTASGFMPSSSTLVASGLTATAFSNTGLAANTTYFYLVTALNSAGTSSPSNQASASTTFAITSITPTSGIVGSSVTIAGSLFGSTQGSSTVSFAGTAATVTSWSASLVVATVPNLPLGVVNVTLTVNGTATAPVSFTVTNQSNPVMTGWATHFDGLGSPFGGCGLPQANLDSQNFVALNVQNTPGNYTLTLPRPIPAADASEIGLFDNGLNCGRWVHVVIGDFCTGTNDGAPGEPFCRGGQGLVADQFNGAALDMIVADSCQDGNAWCRDDPFHLDLATASINQFILNGQPVGTLLNKWNNRQIMWNFEPAPNYTGDITIGFSQGANAFWSAISISHLQNGIHGVDYMQNGSWIAAPTNADLGQTYVVLPTTTGGTSYQIRVHDVNGQIINNGRNYLFSFPASCGTQCGPPYTGITYTTQ